MGSSLDQGPAASGAGERLPHWDMTSIFPGLESAEFMAAFSNLSAGVEALERLFDEHGIRRRDVSAIDPAMVAAFTAVTQRLNTVLDEARTIGAYLRSFVATDSRNDLAQGRLSELQERLVTLQQLETRYEAWLGSLDVDVLIGRSALAEAHAYAVRRAAAAAHHQMSEQEEELAARLNLAGGTAWAKLHGNVTSQVLVTVRTPDGGDRTMPMSAARALAFDPDGVLRQAAYEAELRSWQTVAVPLAAALNSIKGEVNTLCERRRWRDPLAEALFANGIDRATLSAMQGACEQAFPDFRRYLAAKARLLGKTALPWWDLFAPVGRAAGERPWRFAEAADYVVEQFGAYSPKLAGLAERAVREGWIDAEPRDGKRDGAFCMGVRGEESRVLLNYKPAFGSLQTLAHELGHAYHNLNLAKRTPLQRQTPMALAETASIFCETIITNAALATVPPVEQLSILEERLQNACQIVVDIHSRFRFEQGVFERRRQRELAVDEFNALMLEAQGATYGDGLDRATYHPFMWAVKNHYYSTGRSYYNWPYTFGLLFGLGLYACYEEEPAAFRTGYDELLASTGLDSAASLARRFDIDLHSPAFWRSSLDVLRADIRRFEQLST